MIAVPQVRFLFCFILFLTLSAVCIPTLAATTDLKTCINESWPGGLIIDHRHIDIDQIPSEWIDAVKNSVVVHYAHTSHMVVR